MGTIISTMYYHSSIPYEPKVGIRLGGGKLGVQGLAKPILQTKA